MLLRLRDGIRRPALAELARELEDSEPQEATALSLHAVLFANVPVLAGAVPGLVLGLKKG